MVNNSKLNNKIMKKINLLLKIFLIYIFFISNGIAYTLKYFETGKKFYEKKEFDKSKIFFEKDIVFNPKSEKSYLYLAKIFNYNKKEYEEELNLNSVLLLNPKNDEALYLLIILKINQFDYEEAKDLITKFDLLCVDFCSKKEEIEKKLSKITPKDEKNNN